MDYSKQKKIHTYLKGGGGGGGGLDVFCPVTCICTNTTDNHKCELSLATRPIYKYVCHFFFFTFFFFFFFSFIFYFLIQCLASLWVNFSSVVVSEILEIQTILSID